VRKIMQGRGMDCDIHITYPDEIDGSFDTLVNATGAGMYPDVDGCPVSEDVIARAGFVYDVIYNPEETRLMSIARRHGIPAAGGMGMLVYQAAAAHEYWTGAEYDEADIDRLIADMHRMMI
ncbi:MAG: shikimate dehydrogenase, partial [Oscillospiraceae bacterium]|nr:shikimate dehydrogenase [Oscillospiraceae bacterium]